MGFNNLARSARVPATGIACPGGLLVQQPDAGTIQDLKRADQFIPFSPETFLDELVQLFAVSESGASLSPMQFRALPPDVRAAVAAAFLEHFAGSGSNAEAALPRAAGESDAAYLLRYWRDGKMRESESRAPLSPNRARESAAQDAPQSRAEETVSDESKLSAGSLGAGSLGQMDLAKLRLAPLPPREAPESLSSDLPSLNIAPSFSDAPELADDSAALVPEPIGRPIGGPGNRGMVEAPAPRGSGAMLVAVIAVLLALAGIGAGALLFVRQDSANQRMIATLRQRQDALEEANRNNRQTIDSLNDALRHNTTARAAASSTPAPAPSPASVPAAAPDSSPALATEAVAPAVPRPAPNLRSATTSGTPHAAPRNARAPRQNARAKDDDALASVLDSATQGGDEVQMPSSGGQYVDPRYGDPRYDGPQYPVRRGDVPYSGSGY